MDDFDEADLDGDGEFNAIDLMILEGDDNSETLEKQLSLDKGKQPLLNNRDVFGAREKA